MQVKYLIREKKMETVNTIVDKIVTKWIASGSTQLQLAKKLGVTYQTLINIKNGKIKRPHKAMIMNLMSLNLLTKKDHQTLSKEI